jgi:hypothetical protein
LILVSASLAHSCGVQQRLVRSSQQSQHRQYIEGWWGLSLSGVLMRVDARTRSAMVLTRCLWRRHFEGLFLIGRGSDPRWCQVGSWAFRPASNLMAAKLTWYVWAAFSILMVSSSSFAALSPLCGGFQSYRKVLMRAWVFGPWGMDASMIRSVIFAQTGRDGEKSR